MRGDRKLDGSYTGTMPQILAKGNFKVKFMVHGGHCTKEEADSLDGKVLGLPYDATVDHLQFSCSVKFQVRGMKKGA